MPMEKTPATTDKSKCRRAPEARLVTPIVTQKKTTSAVALQWFTITLTSAKLAVNKEAPSEAGGEQKSTK